MFERSCRTNPSAGTRSRRQSIQFGHSRGLPAAGSVFCYYSRKNSASHIEPRSEAHEPGARRLDQIVQYAIGDRFVKSAFVPIRPYIELEAFQLHAESVRDVIEHERREI